MLPNLDEAIESKASHLYGTEPDGEPPLVPLETHLEKLARFYGWFVEGKPAELVLSSAIMPDGEIGTQFVRCWREALKASPQLTPRFTLRADGFRVPLQHGHYRFNRSVLLDPASDDGSDVTVDVDHALLRKGGLFRLLITPDTVRLQPLGAHFPRWKIALRMLRHFRRGVRPEILRRLRANIPFEFSRCHGALQVTLKSGRMPKEVRDEYRRRAALINARLNRVRDARGALELEGRAAAAAFAGDPATAAAQRARERDAAITSFRDARDRLWRIALECYRKTTLPDWPFRTPDEIRSQTKRGLSSRQRIRLDHAVECFTRAHEEVTAYGWNPLGDTWLGERRADTTSQRILAMELTP